MFSLLRCAILVSVLSTTVLGGSLFKKPPPPPANYDVTKNKRYQIGEQLDLEWDMDFPEVDILLFPIWAGPGVNITGNDYFRIAAKSTLQTLTWQVTYGGLETNLKPGQDAVFHFSLYRPGQTSWDSTSSNFNITNTVFKGTTTSASSMSTPTSTRSDDGSSTDAVTSTSSSTSTSTSEPSKDEGLSTGAVAGIAVGATLGGLFLLGVIGFFAWKHFRKPPPPPAPESSVLPRSELETKPPTSYYPQTYNYSAMPNQQPQYNPSPGLYEAP